MEGCRIPRTDIEKVTAEFLLDGRRHRLYHLNWLNKQDQGKFNTVQLFLLKKSYFSLEKVNLFAKYFSNQLQYSLFDEIKQATR